MGMCLPEKTCDPGVDSSIRSRGSLGYSQKRFLTENYCLKALGFTMISILRSV